jgi:hypothetical protein
VKFFEILQGGFHTPLAALQIAGLFQGGGLDQHTDCNSAQTTDYQPINDLLPLLKYRKSRQFARRSPAARRSFRLSLPAAIALIPLGAVTTAAIGYLFFGAQPSKASPIATGLVSPAASTSPLLAKPQKKKTIAQRRSSSPGNSAPVAPVSPYGIDSQSYIRLVEAQR